MFPVRKRKTPTPIKTPSELTYTTELVVPDVEVPWGMVFMPNGSLLYTEKEGKLIRFQYGKKHEISGLPETYVRGQGGLMGIALHPDFEQNKRIYFSMATANADKSGGNTALYSATLLGNSLQDVQLLYKAVPDTKKRFTLARASFLMLLAISIFRLVTEDNAMLIRKTSLETMAKYTAFMMMEASQLTTHL